MNKTKEAKKLLSRDEITLQVVRECPTLSDEDVREEVKKRMIQQTHPYAIYYKPSEKRWCTRAKIDGVVKIVKRKTEKDLYSYLDNLYHQEAQGMTLTGVVREWLPVAEKEAPANTRKLLWAWNKYVKDSALAKMPVQGATEEDVRAYFVWLSEREEALTKRRVMEIKTLLNALFEFAKRKKYCTENVSKQVRGLSKAAYITAPAEKTAQEETFTTAEAKALCDKAWEQYVQYQNPLYLAIPLSFQLGLRAGEVVAIQLADIHDGILTLQRQEVRAHSIDKKNQGAIHQAGYMIKPGLKMGKEKRILPLTKEAMDIITELQTRQPAPSVWLFEHPDGERYNTSSLSHLLTRLCKQTKDPADPEKKKTVKPRSFHKIRKTVISTLLAAGMPVTTVRDLAGHTDARTTLNVYGKSILPAEEVREKMTNALTL